MSAAAESHKRRRDDDGSQTATGAEPADKRVKTEGSADGAAAAAAATTGAATTGAAAASAAGTRKKRRWDTMEPAAGTAPTAAVTAPAAAPAAAAPASGAAPALTAAQKALALQKSIAERLAAAKVPKLAAATSAAGTGVKLEAAAALSAAGLAAPSAAPYHPSPSVIVKDESKSWLPLRLDHLGRQVDEQGRVVQMDRPTELKVNLKAREEAAAPQKHMPHAKIATTIIKEEGMSKFHDPRMPEAKPAERKPRGLVLVRPGKYIQQAATMRMKQLEKDLAESSKAKAAEPVVPVAVSIVKSGAPMPAVEWWDQKLLVDPAAGYDSKPNLDRVTSYIYHPVAVASLTAAPAPPPMPVLLTKKERKKIKKRNKREELKEKQDRVRLGLEAPAEPKMRIQNLMNVLLNDTVADPSAMEAKVRAQMAERVEGHEAANLSRKLTAEQKAEKRRRKFAEDTSAEMHVSVYRAGDLSGGKARYQIDVNAQQWNVSGVAVVHPECSVVVAEGGPKAMRRFRRLMLHRIKWRKKKRSALEAAEASARGEDANAVEEEEESDEDSDSDDDGDANGTDSNEATRSRTGACALVWSGVVPKGRFQQRFTFEACRSEIMARNFLQKLGMESYWDMCRAYRGDQIDV